MAKVIICFDGTGLEGVEEHFFEGLQNEGSLVFMGDVCRIYIKGCHTTAGSAIFPDLSGMADKIANCFSREKEGSPKNRLDLRRLKSEFGDNITIFLPANEDEHKKDAHGNDGFIDVTEVLAQGYSRGGASAYLLAKKSAQHHVEVNYRIATNQTVPGNYYKGQGTITQNINSATENILSVNSTVGTYSKKMSNIVGENVFFNQAIPKLNCLDQEYLAIPAISHLALSGNRIARLHQVLNLVKREYAQGNAEDIENEIKKIYKSEPNETIFLLVTDSKDKQMISNSSNCDLKVDPLYTQALNELYDKELLDFADRMVERFKRTLEDGNTMTADKDTVEGFKDSLAERIRKIAYALDASEQTEQMKMKKAIYSLAKRNMSIEYLEFAMKDTSEAGAFRDAVISNTQVIAGMYESRSLLMCSDANFGKKQYGINTHKNEYLSNLFKLTYECLQNPDPINKQACWKAIDENHKNFVSKAFKERNNPKLDLVLGIIKSIFLNIVLVNVTKAILRKNFKELYSEWKTTRESRLNDARRENEALLSNYNKVNKP